MTTIIAYPHVEQRTDGMPMIAGTPTKVIDVVLDQIAHHWDAYEIRRQRPHLSLAQIYAALAYYHDHQLELDRLLEDRGRREEELVGRLVNSPLQVRLGTLRGGR